MPILVINAGSSSLKLQVIDLLHETVIHQSIIERIGEHTGSLTWQNAPTTEQHCIAANYPNHGDALSAAMGVLTSQLALTNVQISAVGHRVVHGGAIFHSATPIDATVLKTIRSLDSLAPLHNPPSVLGIEAALALLPGVPHVAVFDTAFHQTLPEHSYRYAIPEEWYVRHGVRRYGFHGTSHRYLAHAAAQLLNKPLNQCNLITLHLGNGASAAAIAHGRSIDTSMGFTPLEGLIMGTRSGDIDPAIPMHLTAQATTLDAIEHALNYESGLQGLCGSHDMREILQRAERGDVRATLAVKMYCYRIKKYLGAYIAILGPVDALIFSGGVGENAAAIREHVTQGLAHMGIRIDTAQNNSHIIDAADISAAGAAIRTLVIRTHEELEIARQTHRCALRA